MRKFSAWLLLIVIVVMGLNGWSPIQAQDENAVPDWTAYFLQNGLIVKVVNGEVVQETPLPLEPEEGFFPEDYVASVSGRYLQWTAHLFTDTTESYRYRVVDIFTGEVLVDYADSGDAGSGIGTSGFSLRAGAIDEINRRVAFGIMRREVLGEIEIDGEVFEETFIESEILVFDMVAGEIQTEPSLRLTPEDTPTLTKPYFAYDYQIFEGYMPIVEHLDEDGVYWDMAEDFWPYEIYSRWQWKFSTQTVEKLTTEQPIPFNTDTGSNVALMGGPSVQLLDFETETSTEIFRGRKADNFYTGQFVQNDERVIVGTFDNRSEWVTAAEESGRVFRLIERDGTVVTEFTAAYGRVYGATDGYFYVKTGEPNQLYFVDTRDDTVEDGVSMYEYAGDESTARVLWWVGDN